MFDLNIRYVLDKKHTAINKFSRRSCKLSKEINEIHEENIDNFIDNQFNCVRIYFMRVNEKDDKQFLKNENYKKF